MLTDAEPKLIVKLENILFEKLPDIELITYCIFQLPDCILSCNRSILLLEHSIHACLMQQHQKKHDNQ